MTFLEDRDLQDVPSIPEYYRGKTVFITGGSGFMGKALVEKLLYSCTDLDRIYLLLRPKRGIKPEDRLAQIYSTSCFDRLRKERPGVFQSKVFFIAGDCGELGLGLSEEDRALLVNRTNILFHVAASVRFDEPLKKSAKSNLRSTREMIELAKDMTHLESYVHVSTAYANSNRNPVSEIMYPPLADWRHTLEICDSLDDRTLNTITPKYLGEMPNTYVFTKQLAEHVVYEQKGKLPIVIIRPSVIVSSHIEPLPGWIDNFNGPIGLSIASGKGILRSLYAKPEVSLDYIPVDVVIKGTIAASWSRGTKKLEPLDDVPVYHACASSLNNITYHEMYHIGSETMARIPLDNMVWSTGGALCSSKFVHSIQVLLLHVLPALIIDTLLWILGKKTMVVKVQRRIYSANYALAYYLTQQSTFLNKNFIFLRSNIKEEDKTQFYYDIEGINKYDYCRLTILGARRYLLKEKDEDLPKARAHHKRVTILDQVLKCVFYVFMAWWFLRSDFKNNLFKKVFQ